MRPPTPRLDCICARRIAGSTQGLRTVCYRHYGMGIVRAFRREQPAPEPGPSLPVRPPLKWAGGKRWQVPYLEPKFPKNTPIAGS